MAVYLIKQMRYYKVEADSPNKALDLFQEAFDVFQEGEYEIASDWGLDVEEIVEEE